MARGYDRHKERLDSIQLLGKDLARRARRRCELCEGDGELRPYDTNPDAEPSLDTLVLMCARCRSLAEGASLDPRELRFLATSVWHELPQVGALARELLARIDAPWARETLELL